MQVRILTIFAKSNSACDELYLFDQIDNLSPAKYLRPSLCEIKFPPKTSNNQRYNLVSATPIFFLWKSPGCCCWPKATNITFPSISSLLGPMSYGVTEIALLEKSIYSSYNVFLAC